MHEIESRICNNAAHGAILCNLGYWIYLDIWWLL